MFLFGSSSSPFDADIETVTSPDLKGENWSLLMDICDKINEECKEEKQVTAFLNSVKKRLNNRDANIVFLCVALLDALWNNCPTLRKDISKKPMVETIRSLCTGSDFQVGEKMRVALASWVKNECTQDMTLALLIALYSDLKRDGFSFEPETEIAKKKAQFVDNPDYVNSVEEEEQLLQAIALSLQINDEKRPNKSKATTKDLKEKIDEIYPSPFFGESARKESCSKEDSATAGANDMHFKVRVLYDFEAGEDNELTIATDDVITVTDSSDPNWWSGKSHRGMGLFPASFVSTDLECGGNGHDSCLNGSLKEPKIDMDVLINCINMMEAIDPRTTDSDPFEVLELEQQVEDMAPLVEEKIVEIDNAHAELSRVEAAIRNVLAMYDEAIHDLVLEHENAGPSQWRNSQMLPNEQMMYGQQPQMNQMYYQQQQYNPQIMYGQPPQMMPNQGNLQDPNFPQQQHNPIPYPQVPQQATQQAPHQAPNPMYYPVQPNHEYPQYSPYPQQTPGAPQHQQPSYQYPQQ